MQAKYLIVAFLLSLQVFAYCVVFPKPRPKSCVEVGLPQDFQASVIQRCLECSENGCSFKQVQGCIGTIDRTRDTTEQNGCLSIGKSVLKDQQMEAEIDAVGLPYMQPCPNRRWGFEVEADLTDASKDEQFESRGKRLIAMLDEASRRILGTIQTESGKSIKIEFVSNPLPIIKYSLVTFARMLKALSVIYHGQLSLNQTAKWRLDGISMIDTTESHFRWAYSITKRSPVNAVPLTKPIFFAYRPKRIRYPQFSFGMPIANFHRLYGANEPYHRDIYKNVILALAKNMQVDGENRKDWFRFLPRIKYNDSSLLNRKFELALLDALTKKEIDQSVHDTLVLAASDTHVEGFVCSDEGPEMFVVESRKADINKKISFILDMYKENMVMTEMIFRKNVVTPLKHLYSFVAMYQ